MNNLYRPAAVLVIAFLITANATRATPATEARVCIVVDAENKVLESRIRGTMTEALRKIGDVRIVTLTDRPFFAVRVAIVDIKFNNVAVGWAASYAMTTFTRVADTDLVVEKYSRNGVVYSDYSEDHTRQVAESIIEDLDSRLLLAWRSMVANRPSGAK